MKIDLEDLERKAAEVIAAQGEHHATDVLSDAERIAGQRWIRAREDHRRANSPPVTLALIARIRNLETALDAALDIWCSLDEANRDENERATFRKVLDAGAVLP